MKTSTRLTIVAVSMLVCVAGILIAHCESKEIGNACVAVEPMDTVFASDGYQFAASRKPKLTFQQLESIIRRDPVAKSQRGRIEFGSVRMEEGSALAEVLFVTNDGRVFPFLYKLQAQRDSWKIVNVQRIWYVPRSRLLRGVKA